MARSSPGIETKAAAGPTTALIAGYISWAVIEFVPGVKNNVPADLQSQLPVVIGAALGWLAAYRAPHTHRPDLPPLEPDRMALTAAVEAYLESRRQPVVATRGAAATSPAVEVHPRGVGSSP